MEVTRAIFRFVACPSRNGSAKPATATQACLSPTGPLAAILRAQINTANQPTVAVNKYERKPVDECADYLLHYSPYLQYDKALAEGVPIATGVIEGACRHLVEDRMNLTGARWRLTGAEAVLRLRALRSSNDFDAYWEFHEQQEYERHHASHYADHRVPETVPSAASSSRPSRRDLAHRLSTAPMPASQSIRVP